MANTLTNLINEMHMGLDTVSRELVGFIPAVRKDSTADAVAENETIRFPVVPSMTAGSIAPAATGPDPDAQTIGNDTLTINNFRNVTFYWEGEEQKGLSRSGTYNTILSNQFAQAYRTLANEAETDLAELYKNASRAYGTAGTTPFGTADQLDDLSYAVEILEKNGVPSGADIHAVLDTRAMANMRGYQGIIFKANEAGSLGPRATGAVGQLFNAMLHTSGQVQKHTAGTGADYDVDFGAGYSSGDTTIHVDTGTGTFVQGDVITLSGDTSNKYVVKTGFAGDGDGDIVVQDPGLIQAAADNEDVAFSAAYRANMVFDRNAILLATRVPAMPLGGDNADDVMVVTDPVSGLSFQVAMYRQYRRVAFEVALAWGVKVIKPEHIALILG